MVRIKPRDIRKKDLFDKNARPGTRFKLRKRENILVKHHVTRNKNPT